MNKYIPLFCISLLPLFGCSTTHDQARNRAENVASQRLEKRIDDLSGTISLLVNDGNRLHTDLGEVKLFTEDIQRKTDGLATSIRVLEERMDAFAASVKDRDAAHLPHSDDDAVAEQSSLADFNKLLEKVISDVQRVVGSEEVVASVEGQTKPPTTGDATAVQTKNAGIEKKDGEQGEAKDAVRLVLDGAQHIPEEKKAVGTPVVTQELAVSDTVKTPEVAEDLGAGLKTETTGIVAVTAVAPVIQEAIAVAMGTSTVDSTQNGSETVVKQTSEPKTDVIPPKQDAAGFLTDPRTREPYLKDAIGRLAEKVFPDNKGIQWNIISFDHKAHLTHTEAAPLHVDLGYPRFKFVISFKTPENPGIIGTYSFSGGQYTPYFVKKK